MFRKYLEFFQKFPQTKIIQDTSKKKTQDTAVGVARESIRVAAVFHSAPEFKVPFIFLFGRVSIISLSDSEPRIPNPPFSFSFFLSFRYMTEDVSSAVCFGISELSIVAIGYMQSHRESRGTRAPKFHTILLKNPKCSHVFIHGARAETRERLE